MKILKYILVLFLLLSINVFATVDKARLMTSTGTTTQYVYYETGATGSHTYIDGRGSTADLALEINSSADDVASKYVGVLFMINYSSISGSRYNLTSKDLGSYSPYHALVQTGDSYACGTGRYCANASTSLFSFVDTTVTDGYGVPVALSAYPAYLIAVISDNQSIEDGDNITTIATTDGQLRGSFTVSSVGTTYNQTSGNVQLDVTGVTVYTTSSASQSIDTNYQDKQYIAVGICEDTRGQYCNSTAMISKTDSTINLFTGVTLPTDQVIATKYYVLNGIGTSFCIGNDAQGNFQSVSPTTVYYGQNITVRYRTYNNGNVNITTDFNMSLYMDTVLIDSTIMTETINAYSYSSYKEFNWTANLVSGSHTFKVASDLTSLLTECSEANNNATQGITVSKVFTPYIYINDTLTDNFTRAGVPHNVSIFINDSDGTAQGNARINITELNGISIFSPVQNWTDNYGDTGLISTSMLSVRTNSSGWVLFTMIPTSNPIFIDYPNYDLDTYVGNYSLTMQAWTSAGTLMTYTINGATTQIYTLYITNTTYDDTGFSNSVTYNNQLWHVQSILDWAYKIYSMFKKLILSM